MFETIRNAWKLADLRKKIIYTLIIIFIYRIGTALPIPYLDGALLQNASLQADGSVFQYLNILSGNAFSNGTLFALGINPYITASIVLQLLCVAIPALERLSKEGEEGRKKINQLTRYITVGLGLLTAFGYYRLLSSYGVITETGFFPAVVIIACYCAGSALVMWIAEKINENGIGNGISIILFANIISRLPSMVLSLIKMVTGKFPSETDAATGAALSYFPWWAGVIIAVVAVVVAIAMVAFIVWMTNSERKLPIQYAKKVVGRKMYGGQSSNLPIKVNMVGVMPIIFANSIITIPATIDMFVRGNGKVWRFLVDKVFSSGSLLYALLTLVLLVAFAYFYIAISFNPVEVANNIKNQGGFIPGIRPGRPTSDYISKVLSRITFIGAILLAVVAILPLLVNIFSGGRFASLAFGGSSVIIVVGVVLETIREIEAQMTMRHYKSFLD